MVTAWSYSRWADYDQCPAKFKYKHLDRLPAPGSAAMARGNEIHKVAENYVKGKTNKVPPELKNFSAKFQQLRGLDAMVEQEWGFKKDFVYTGRKGWFGDDVWFRAKADVFIVYEDKTGDLIDHKTGKKYETNKDQVELFTLAGFRRLPELTHITTRLWYLDIEDEDEQEVIAEYTAHDAALIQRDWNKKVIPMFSDRKFAPKPNNKCGWCDFSARKGGPCKF
jgi:hypothetical protein